MLVLQLKYRNKLRFPADRITFLQANERQGDPPLNIKDLGEITKKMAMPIINRAGWKLIGYFSSVTGTINDVVHLWYWDSQAQREELQVKATSDPEWKTYQAANGHRIQKQESRYLVPTKFSPIK